MEEMVLKLKAMDLQMRLNPRVQLLHLKRLGDVIDAAVGECSYFVQRFGEGADDGVR